MSTKSIILSLLSGILFISCHTPQVGYFGDLKDGTSSPVMKVLDIRIRPEDKLSIVVKSKDPLLSELFNLPVVSSRIGYSQAASINSSQHMSVYTVDKDGEIDFPVIGKVKIENLTREQVAQTIKQLLMSNQSSVNHSKDI